MGLRPGTFKMLWPLAITGHNELWRPSGNVAFTNLTFVNENCFMEFQKKMQGKCLRPVTFKILWPLAATNCGGLQGMLRLQILCLLMKIVLWNSKKKMQVKYLRPVTFKMLWPLATTNC